MDGCGELDEAWSKFARTRRNRVNLNKRQASLFERVRANIAKLEEKLEKAERTLKCQEFHLLILHAKLEAMVKCFGRRDQAACFSRRS